MLHSRWQEISAKKCDLIIDIQVENVESIFGFYIQLSHIRFNTQIADSSTNNVIYGFIHGSFDFIKIIALRRSGAEFFSCNPEPVRIRQPLAIFPPRCAAARGSVMSLQDKAETGNSVQPASSKKPNWRSNLINN